MHALGIQTGADLRAFDLPTLTRHFGKAAGFYYGISRGIDERPVVVDRERKSLGTEQTYLKDLRDEADALDALAVIAAKLWGQSTARSLQARTVTLKVKYSDFRQITRARTLSFPIPSQKALAEASRALLQPLFPLNPGVRLLGLTLSGFSGQATSESPANSQMSLFPDTQTVMPE